MWDPIVRLGILQLYGGGNVRSFCKIRNSAKGAFQIDVLDLNSSDDSALAALKNPGSRM